MRWQGGRWVFRARLVVEGHHVVGSWHEDQDQAIDDRQKLVLRRAVVPRRILTLRDALRAVIARARDRGLHEDTVRKHHESHSRFIEQFWDPDETRMTQLTLPELQRMVRVAVDELGRSPNTLRQKDLPILRECYELAGLVDVTVELRKTMAAKLKYVPPRMVFFEPAEIVELVKRMRDEPIYRQKDCEDCAGQAAEVRAHCEACQGWGTVDDRKRKPIIVPGREADADLVEFIASTGVRAGELERIALGDVDLEHGAVRVAEPKDRGNPRDLVVSDVLRPVVERMVERARGEARRGLNPDARLVPNAMNRLTLLAQRWKPRLRDRRLNGRALRHTFGTGVLTATGSADAARSLLGHKHFATTDRYVHEVSGRREKAAGDWIKHLDQLRQAAPPPATDESDGSGDAASSPPP